MMVKKVQNKGQDIKTDVLPLRFLLVPKSLLAVALVGNGQLLAAFGATCSQYAATICGCHSLTEAVLVVAAAVVGLECSFHRCMCVFVISF